MLTKTDLKQIENLVKLLLIGSNSQVLKEIDELKEKVEEMDNKINFLPTIGSLERKTALSTPAV